MQIRQALSARDVGPGVPSGPTEALHLLRTGQAGVIVGIESGADAVIARRLYDIGFAPGRTVSVVRRSATGGRAVFRVSGTEIALRRQQSATVLVHLS